MLLSYLLVQIKSFSISDYYLLSQNVALELELWIELKRYKNGHVTIACMIKTHRFAVNDCINWVINNIILERL